MSKKSNRTRRKFSPEFKSEAVQAYRHSGKSLSAAARDLGISESGLRKWVVQTEVDSGSGDANALTTEDQEELRRLRRENRTLRMEREILKKATAFFAKEST